MSIWHRHDGSKVTYQNPDQRRQLWLNPQGAVRAFPYIGTASILKIAGNVRMEGEMIRAGWRRVATRERTPMAEHCDQHLHSQFRPCVNGLTTHDYLRGAWRQAPLNVGEMVATRVLELPASEESPK